MKNLYLVISEDIDGEKDNYVLKVSKNRNLLSVLNSLYNATGAMFCETKKEAVSIATMWNEIDLKDGRHLYQDWKAYKGNPAIVEYR